MKPHVTVMTLSLGIGLLASAVWWLVSGLPYGYVVSFSLLGAGLGLCAIAFQLWPRRD